MNHQSVDLLLIGLIFVAFILGKFRGFRDGCHLSDEIIDARNREIEEMLRTGRVAIDVAYHPVEESEG